MPVQIAQIVKSYSLWLCLLMITLPVYAGPQVVGHISFVKGNNAAQQPGEAPRILGKDTEIFQGDNIQTTERSFVIVEFTDGAKVTVRPNSNFSIDHYGTESTNKTAQLVLHQGGVNTSTGAIAKDNPENFQIKTPTATIKPKSEKAEFNVRICDKECEENGKKEAANTERTEQSVVARVVEIKGEVAAINRADKNAKERPLSLGNPLYNSDSVYSEKNSYALLVFPDGQKITLQPDSEMDIKQYNFQIKGKKDQVLLRLAAGGLRALTGSIGKNNHDAYALDTPVATIGIRGTLTYTAINGSQFEHRTESGLSFVRDAKGEWDVPQGYSLSKSDPNEIPLVFPTPHHVAPPLGPKLEQNDADTRKLFEKRPPAAGDTITDAKTGTHTVENNNNNNIEKTEVNEGESGAAKTGGETTILSNQPVNRESDNNSPGNNPSNNGSLLDDDPSNLLDGC
ncbi:MAG: FecR family protein [Methylobacter sp.]